MLAYFGFLAKEKLRHCLFNVCFCFYSSAFRNVAIMDAESVLGCLLIENTEWPTEKVARLRERHSNLGYRRMEESSTGSHWLEAKLREIYDG